MENHIKIFAKIDTEMTKQNKQHKELTDYLGINKSTYNYWEKGGKSFCNHITQIAHFLNTTTDYLLSDNDNLNQSSINQVKQIQINQTQCALKLSEKEQECLELFKKLPLKEQQYIINLAEMLYEYIEAQKSIQIQTEYVRVRDIPYYPFSASAGSTGEQSDEPTETDYITVILDDISEQADFVVQVSGDSMKPEYDNEDYVLVKRCEIVPTGEEGIFIYEGSMVMKIMGNGELLSYNKSQHPPLKLYDGCGFYPRGIVLGKAQIT